MPCSVCYGVIGEGSHAARCSCGDISHLSCGIKTGRCPECGADYEGMIDQVGEEEIIKSVEDSRRTAKKTVEAKVEWDEGEDLMRKLLKQVINKEISIEEFKMLSGELKGTFG